MKQEKIFKLAELFCGPGGLSFGAMSAAVTDPKGKTYKVKPVWANDMTPTPAKPMPETCTAGMSKG